MAGAAEIQKMIAEYVPGYGFTLNGLCKGIVYELTYSSGRWFAYSKLTNIPLIESVVTVVEGTWSVKDFAGLVQTGHTTVYVGSLPEGVSIPTRANVYVIGDPGKGLIPVRHLGPSLKFKK